MELDEIVEQFLSENKLMQLATVDSGQPWLCSVFFVADENRNIYWTSARKRRHSKEILSNPIAAATIVHNEASKQALQITGEAFEVELDDAERVNALYGNKFGNKPSRLEEVMANTPDGRAYWVLKPITISLWDEVNFPDSPKQELVLSKRL